MSDTHTTTSTRSYGQRLKGGLAGIILGPILFVMSFYVLYTNEGRVDLSKIAIESIEITSESQDMLDGDFVSLTGPVETDEQLGDNVYIEKGDFIALNRKSEMFAWVEDAETTTTENLGGSETTTTTYTYTKEWTEYPTNSTQFEKPSGHENPSKAVASQSFEVGSISLLGKDIQTQGLILPDGSNLLLSSSNLIASNAKKLSAKELYFVRKAAEKRGEAYEEQTSEMGYTHTDQYIFIGDGSLTQPTVGDTRVSYSSMNHGDTGTLFGKVLGESITSYVYDVETSIFRLFSTTRAEAISIMRSEYVTALWLMRLVGFLIMWIGMSLFFSLFSTLLAVIPFLGKLSRSLVGFVTFVISLILSSITILIGIITHNIFLLVGIVLLIVIGVILFLKRGGKKNQGSYSPSYD